MNARHYEVTYMGCWGEKVEKDYTDLDEVTYQAQNYEGCNVKLTHRDEGYSQTIAVDYSGDDYCDVVPIVDWTVPRDRPDVVSALVHMIREDVLGDEA
jgi:hypothetical protein